MTNVFGIIISIVLIVGGIYTFLGAKRYFKLIKTKGTDNVFAGYGAWFGFFIGALFTLGGIAMLISILQGMVK